MNNNFFKNLDQQFKLKMMKTLTLINTNNKNPNNIKIQIIIQIIFLTYHPIITLPNVHNTLLICQPFLLIFKLNNHKQFRTFYNRIINILNYKLKNNRKYHNIVIKVKEKRELNRQ